MLCLPFGVGRNGVFRATNPGESTMIKAFGFGIVLVAAFCAPGATADPITYYYTGQDFTQVNPHIRQAAPFPVMSQ